MSQPMIASVIGDAGGAEALVPVLVSLARRGRLGSVLAGPAAWSALERGGVGFERLEASDDPGELLDRFAPAGLLTSTSWGERPVELAFFGPARARGIPTIAVIDFWANYRSRFEGSDRELALPDWIAVPDDRARAEAIGEGLPAERLVALGNPNYESLLVRFRTFDGQARAAFRERVGIRRQATMALFVSQPLRALYGDQLGYDERSALVTVQRALEEVAEWLGHPIDLAVRAHPREESIAVPTTGSSVRVHSAAGEEALSWAMASDLVIGMTSAVLLQAAMLGARVVSVQPNLRGPDRLPSNRLGLSVGVYHADRVPAALYRALARPAHTQSASALHQLRLGATGATSRFAEFIDQLMREDVGVPR